MFNTSQMKPGMQTWILGSALLIALIGLVNSQPAVAQQQQAERPNIIIFVADDLNWNDVGAYGHPTIRTPHMDRLAKAGMQFNRAFLTTSSCSPSRASIRTGQYPHSTGAGELHIPLPKSKTIMSTPLRKAGYWTASVGKWHIGGEMADQVDYKADADSGQMGEAWVNALRKRPDEKPFFLWAAHHDPHRGYSPDKTLDEPYTADQVAVPPYLPDTPVVRKDLAAYYNEVTRFDQHVGRVLDELKKQGLAENTFVLVISDNGRPFPHCKTRINTPGVKTPFIVRWPGQVEPSQQTDSVVSAVDIAPTVLEIAGAEPLEQFQGQSLMPILKDPEAEVRQYAFAEHNWHDYRAYERAVHGKQYVYVRNWLPNTPATPPADAVNSPTYDVMRRLWKADKLKYTQDDVFVQNRGEHFLYDQESDPYNIFNLADAPAYSEPLKRMQKALADWRQRTDDSFPGKSDLTPSAFDRETGDRVIDKMNPSLDE